MNKKIALAMTTAIFCISSASAKTYSDKSFLMPRDQITNLAMEYTTWHKSLTRQPDAKYNGTIQAVAFYQESTNKSDMGKYFGFDWEGEEGLSIEDKIGVGAAATRTFGTRSVIHSHTEGHLGGELDANYKFEPYQDVYGVRLAYNQDLDKLLDGLFFRVNAPIVNVRNNMNITALAADAPLTFGTADSFSQTTATFLEYLSGKYENTVANQNRQDALQYAKIDGSSHSRSGIADVDVQLGYRFLYKEKTRASFSIGMTIPTGTTPSAEYLFEPVYGNGDHWAIGATFDGAVTFWKNDDKSLDLMLVAKYRYLFEGTEKRTLDFFRQTTGSGNSGGYYFLGGEVGQSKVFPLANILTQDVKVTPGSMFDGILAFAFHFGNFVFDLGYNFYAREAESVSLKTAWENDKYGEANFSYQTDHAFTLAAVTAYQGAINDTHLDFSTIRTPSQVTHKAYVGFGYEWTRFEYPFMLGIGGSYEYTDRNSALEGWALWLKGAISW